MIVKRNVNNPIVYKMPEGSFKDTSCADDINSIYDYISDISCDLDDLLKMLKSIKSEESSYLQTKLSKVLKYMSGIAFRPGCYDSQGCYYGDSDSASNHCSCVAHDECMQTHGGCDVPTAGCYPNDTCVVTSE